MLPVSKSYPPGVANPIVARAIAALPGGGAYDPAPIEFPVGGDAHIALFLQYERGAAGGAVEIMIEVSPFSQDQLVFEDWFQASLYDAGAIVAGADTQSLLQRESLIYHSTGAGIETIAYGPLGYHGTVERMRISAREHGVVGTPGDCGIVAVFYSVS